MEAVNSYDSGPSVSRIAFWQSKLNQGFRVTGIGGGDNHNALTPIPGPGSIGCPTTVVWAGVLFTGAILDGILAGHTSIDVTGSTDRVLEFTASSSTQRAAMGDTLRSGVALPPCSKFASPPQRGETRRWSRMAWPLVPSRTPTFTQPDRSFSFQWATEPGRHWFRVNRPR
jgi:hypothetical protein